MALIRIINVDFYMNAPIPDLDVTYSEFRSSAVKQVPVIRIFGSSNTGDKTCLHVHGAFPYIYVPYDGSDNVDSVIYQIALSLDKAINVSFGQTNSLTQHVYKIVLVSGRPMYGYHAREHQFLKIFFYNPLLIRKACLLLQNGSVMGKIFQPHEAHLPYVLQFMIDYNLHGMSFISLSKILYRQNSTIFGKNTAPPELFLPAFVQKTSTCSVECDTLTIYIENRIEVASGVLASNPGISALWEDEKQRRRDKEQSSQLSSCLTQNRKNLKPTQSHNIHLKTLVHKLKRSSQEKSEDSTSLSNISIYPAEKPRNRDMATASDTLSHTTTSQTVNNSLEHPESDLDGSVFLDPDAQQFLKVLKDLNQEETEEDSVLSQKVDRHEEEVEFDMSLPLNVDDFDFSSWDIEKIPQIDGPPDSLKKNKKGKRKKGKIKEVNDRRVLQEETVKHFLSKPTEKKNCEIILQRCDQVKETPSVSPEKIRNCENYNKLTEKMDALLFTYKPSSKSIKSTRKIPTNYLGMCVNVSNCKMVNPPTSCTCKVKVPRKRRATVSKKNNKEKKDRDEHPPQPSDSCLTLYDKNFMTVQISVPPEYGNNLILSLPAGGNPVDPSITDLDEILKTHEDVTPNMNENYMDLINEIDAILTGNPGTQENEQIIQQRQEKVEENTIKCSKEQPVEIFDEFGNVYQLPSIAFDKNEKNEDLLEKICQENVSDKVESSIQNTKEAEVENFENPEQNSKIKRFSLNFLLSNYQHILNQLDIQETQQFIDYIQWRLEKRLYKSIESTKKSPFGKFLKLPEVKRCKHGLYKVKKKKTPTKGGRVKLKRNCTLKSLDGAWDSSSDEESDLRGRKRTVQTPKYTPLPVLVNSLAVLSKDTSKNENKLKRALTSTNNTAKKKSKSKRSSANLEKTQTEEHLECRYSLRNKKIKQENVVEREKIRKNIYAYLEPKKIILQSEENFKETKNVEKIDLLTKKSIPDVIEEEKSPELLAKDCLPSNDIIENSMLENSRKELQKPILNTSKKYDMENNYVAMAGPSQPQNLDSNSFVLLSQTKIFLEEQELFDNNTFSHPPSTSSSSITPYQKDPDTSFVAFSQRLSLSHFQSQEDTLKKEFDLTEDGCKVIMPKYNPPTYQMILSSMKTFDIPQVRNQEPFYSDVLVNSTTTTVEVGHNSLKIPSNKSIDLEEFYGEKGAEGGLESYRRNVAKNILGIDKKNNRNLKLSFCSYEDCLVTPAKLPPTREEVEKWLEDSSKTVKKDTGIPKKETKKRKIRILNSPDKDDNESCDDESLTLTPNTPLESRMDDFKDQQVEDKTTPKGDSRSVSPVLDKKSKKLKHLRKTKKLELCKSLLKTQFSNSSDSRQISSASLNNTYGFQMSLENLQKARALTEHQYVTLLIMEVHTSTRGDLNPDPEYDPIKALFYTIFDDVPDQNKQITTGIIAVKQEGSGKVGNQGENGVHQVNSEEDLFNTFVDLVRKKDPDILAGYEIEMHSWGYLIDRGYTLNINLKSLLSRSNVELKRSETDLQEGESNLTITGRIVLDVWRLLRHEMSLQSYTFENVMYHVMHRRVPKHSYKDLTFWWEHKSSLFWKRTADYYLFRVRGLFNIMEQLDIIGRTSELARLFGIQFYEVLSRGSQFRVESMMLRLAKPLNYIPVSPSVQQRAKMNAPEYLPLIFEPQSRFYADPVIVLDFQSLYPSMIIAYNYCFSTCLGKVERLGKDAPFEFGATQLKISRNRLKKLIKADALNVSPCGAVFVKESVTEGILPRMLREILDTRLMVKKSMKENNKENKTLQRVLHNRQLGLKLIANVTYGYTAANFSGRMPSVEVGDSVVSKGRETLLRAIKMVENSPEWGAKVVYGDTDSMFVLVSGRSRDEAFRIGTQIADAVTNDNPSPVKLKLEKIFQPCILQTKKRYVGYMYESPEQKEPELCCKGIETVRRDGCPAVSKMLEKCLKILFETKDVSLVRQYVVKQFGKVFSGRVSLQDLTFAKEYRGEAGYRPGACVPALELARKWRAVDRRSEPRRKERVPYVIINGPPGLPLIKLVRSPRELLSDPNLRINTLYYITHVIIPPLNRCLKLIGADVNNWFKEMPRKQTQYLPSVFGSDAGKKSTISQYFSTTCCVTCMSQAQNGVCERCLCCPEDTVVLLQERVRIWEKDFYETRLICQSCCRRQDGTDCTSLDCPVLYRLNQAQRDLQQAPFVRQLIETQFLF